MRRSLTLPLLFALLLAALGCSKKPAPAPDEPGKGAKVEALPERTKYIANLKNTRQETRLTAIEELSWIAEDDPAVLPELVEMLKEKGTAGAGRTLPNQINSTREAAAAAIMACTKGEAVMKQQGLPVLRAGLSDPSPVIREHTAYTIAQLGAVGKPLAPDVQKLCTDPDPNVRGVAFDALRVLGVADPVALAKLLKHDNEEVVRLSAELIPLVTDMPMEAVMPLSQALASPNANVRAAAAEGLAIAGPKAAATAGQLVEIIKKSYPEMLDPTAVVPGRREGGFGPDGPEASYWRALVSIGPAAVEPTAKLLEHPNPMVRSFAARTLGEIGPPAIAATDALKKALGDMHGLVCIEAAVALCRLGVAMDEASALMKRVLDAPNDSGAAAAIEGITRMGETGKKLVPLALEKLKSPSSPARLAAVTLVGLLSPKEASNAAIELGKLAIDPDPEVRRRVGAVLEYIGPFGAPAAEAVGKALPDERDSGIRDQFVEALVAMGPGAKPALPGLLPLVASKGLLAPLRARVIAATVLADPASPEVDAALIKASADDDMTVRCAAAEALGKLNPLPADALATLVKMAKNDPKYVGRLAALRGFTSAGMRAQSAKSDIEALTTNAQPGLALWAKVALAAINGDVSASAPTVRATLTQRNSLARSAAAEALLVIGPTTADLPALIKLLKDQLDLTRISSAKAVGRLGPDAKDAAPQLRKLLDDNNAEVRAAGADALGMLGSAALPAVPRLKELLADPSVKESAQRALAHIGAK
jgi:HEAT repeat protein